MTGRGVPAAAGLGWRNEREMENRMSSVMLFAADRALKEVQYPPGFTVDFDVDNGIVDDGGMDDGFSIFSKEKVLELSSEKVYFAELQWNYTPGRAQKVIEYLEEQLDGTDEIEVWHVWQDMDFDHRVRKVTIPVDELSVEDLRELDRLEVWREPVTDYCYVVTRAANQPHTRASGRRNRAV